MAFIPFKERNPENLVSPLFRLELPATLQTSRQQIPKDHKKLVILKYPIVVTQARMRTKWLGGEESLWHRCPHHIAVSKMERTNLAM